MSLFVGVGFRIWTLLRSLGQGVLLQSLRWILPATLGLLIMVIFAGGYGAPASGQRVTAPGNYVDDELLVKFAPGTPALQILQAHERTGGKVVREVSALGVQVVKVGKGRAATMLPVYQRDPNVEYAELNTIYKALDDPFYPTQWGLLNTGQLGGTPDADIDAPDAWPMSTGSGIKIAVLDTGIRVSHEEVGSGKVVLEANFSTSSTRTTTMATVPMCPRQPRASAVTAWEFTPWLPTRC